MIKAVIFDYYDVLATDQYWHSVIDYATKNHQLDEVYFAQQGLNNGSITWTDFCKKISTVMHQSVDDVVNGYDGVHLNQDVLNAVKNIKNKYKVALLSNAGAEQLSAQLNHKGIDVLFDEIIISSEVGVSKPSIDIFVYAAQKLQCLPSECIMIDDNKDNILGAKSCGMTAIHFKDIQQLQEALKDKVEL
jgi:HAD superfamily hydrolase (TIGR01549 family)